MFSPDELITNGGFVNSYGYDHTGEKLSGNPSLDDFFNTPGGGVGGGRGGGDGGGR